MLEESTLRTRRRAASVHDSRSVGQSESSSPSFCRD